MVFETEADTLEWTRPAPAAETDAMWHRIHEEAEQALAAGPSVAPLLISAILEQPGVEAAVFGRVASRVKDDVIGHTVLLDAFHRAAEADPGIGAGIRADLLAVEERDPATTRLIEPLLYYKGFHALQLHRLAHWLWLGGERDFALFLQSRGSEVFGTDIHPAARIGKGVLLDHATGLVVGGTAVVEDDVTLLQDVTLGATGKVAGDRHPKVRRGAVVGAGAKVLGNIELGAEARVAAGSVVLVSVAPGVTVAGVPARPVRVSRPAGETDGTDGVLQQEPYQGFDYVI